MLSSDDAKTLWSIINKMDPQDVRLLNKGLCDRLNALSRLSASCFRCGDRVEWKSKYGYPITGTVTHIMQKNVSVIADNKVRWRVAGSLLRKV